MTRRGQVEVDNVGRLAFKVRIGRPHVAFQAMGLQPGSLPYPRHHRVLDAEHRRQLPGAPVRRAIRRRLLRAGQNPRFQTRRETARLGTPVSTLQTGDSIGQEACFPLGDRGRTPPDAIGDLAVRHSVGEQQQALRATRRVRTASTRPSPRFQRRTFISRQHNLSCRWHAPSYALRMISTIH